MKRYTCPQLYKINMAIMESAILSGSNAGNIHREEAGSEALAHKKKYVLVSEEW